MSDAVWSGPRRSFAVPIERGLVEAFAHAVKHGDASALPPTFAVVADRFDPEYPRRPPPGEGWARGAPATLLHAEQWFSYHAPLRVGEELIAHRGIGRSWEKRGRSGILSFVEERTELRAADGALRVASGWVDVRSEASHASVTHSQRERRASETVARRPGEAAVAEELSPTQLVLYVAAAGDFHPLHHDDAFARAHGYPTIFAPGMLTMALTAGAVVGRVGSERIARLASRFRAQVWPGDSLFVSFSASGADALGVRTRNQHDETVLETLVQLSGGALPRAQPRS